MQTIVTTSDHATALSAVVSLLLGYIAGVGYFSLCLEGSTLSAGNDFSVAVIWVGIYTFTVGAVIFLPVHFLVPRDHIFWRSCLSIPLGAVSG